MPLNPGNERVTFTYAGMANDKYHRVTAIPSQSLTQEGCNIQPMSVKDDITNTAFAEATHRCLAPYTEATVRVKAEWFATAGGTTYRVMGAKRHEDNYTRGSHITFILKEESG